MVPVIYAVSMECQGYALSDVTLTSSHEIAESATDGYSSPTTMDFGYYLNLDDPNTFGWNDVMGGEVADLCVDFFGLGQDHTPEGSFTAQRIWSTSKAMQLKNPCIPVPSGSVYYNAFPEKALFVMDVGATRTFTVTGFADATNPDWYVSTQDVTTYAQNPGYLQMSVSGTTINSGKTLQVTMKLLQDPSNSPNGEADGVILSTNNASAMNATSGNYWPFTVVTADAGVAEPSGLQRRPGRLHSRPRMNHH
jgi:hypothetical protein